MDNKALIGRRIRNGGIELESVIGVGGMGCVYMGKDLILGRPVAVKVMHPELMDKPGLRQNFKAEAIAATCLWHPNIIQIIDLWDEDDGTSCLIMEFAPGVTLADVIEKDFPIATPRLIRILSQILTGLQVAHDEGLIHRDLKPENIMLHDLPGNPDFVKILDFGVAKRMEHMTETREAITGTPHFMSPEQASGKKTDPRSDLYSVGVLLYQAITRELPFIDSAVPVLEKVKNTEPLLPTLTNYGSYVDPALEPICLKAMAKDPQERYQSAQEFRTALLQVLSPEFEGIDDNTLNNNNTPNPVSVRLRQPCSNVSVLTRQLRFLHPVIPETEYKILVKARTEFETQINSFGGHFANHLGNLSSAFFGLDMSQKQAAGQAILSAQKLIKNEERNPNRYFSQHFGIAGGDLIIRDKFQDIHGLALEKSIELAQSASSSEICADANVVANAPEYRFETIHGAEKCYRVLESIPELAPVSIVPEIYIPVLGREAELKVLYEAFENIIVDRKCVRMAITSKVGMGKTRLLNFVSRHAKLRSIPVFRIQAERFAMLRPAYALARLANNILEHYEGALMLDEHSQAVIKSLIEGKGAQQHCSLFWLDSVTYAMHEMLHAVPETFIFICDNFDYIDAVSFSILDHLLMKFPKKSSIFVSGDYSSELISAFLESAEELRLEAISDEDIMAFLRLSLPKISIDIHQRAIELCQGNPEHLRLLVDYLEERQSYGNVMLPESIPALIIAKLERIPELARRVLAMAACLGRSFPYEVLFEACPNTWNITQALPILEKYKLLQRRPYQNELWLEFVCIDVIRIAASQLTESALTNIHQRFAKYYYKLNTENADKFYQLSRHLYQSNEVDKAFTCLSLTAQKVFDHYGAEATIPVLNTIMEFAHNVPDPSLYSEEIFLAVTLLIYARHNEEALELVKLVKTYPPTDAYYKQQILVVGCSSKQIAPMHIIHKLNMALDSAIKSLAYRALAHYYLALNYDNMGNSFDAIRHISRAVEIFEENDEYAPLIFKNISFYAYFFYIHILQNAKQYAHAEEQMRRVLKRFPEYSPPYIRAAYQLTLALSPERSDEARAIQERIIQSADACTDYFTLASCLSDTAFALEDSNPELSMLRMQRSLKLCDILGYSALKQNIVRRLQKSQIFSQPDL
ncbi:MAG: protein kinase [Bradymonadales bacterium]